MATEIARVAAGRGGAILHALFEHMDRLPAARDGGILGQGCLGQPDESGDRVGCADGWPPHWFLVGLEFICKVVVKELTCIRTRVYRRRPRIKLIPVLTQYPALIEVPTLGAALISAWALALSLGEGASLKQRLQHRQQHD